MALYDPGDIPVEVETEAVDPLAGFEAWVRAQPTDGDYAYHDVKGCALALFLVAHGRNAGARYFGVGGSVWSDNTGTHDIPENVRDALCEYPRTFGALADRLAA